MCKKFEKFPKMSSKESTTTNSSDGTGTHHSLRSDSVPRSFMSAPAVVQQDHHHRNHKNAHHKHHYQATANSVRSRSSIGDGSIGSSASQKPVTVTYKSVTTSGMLFSKKTTSVDCGVFVKDPG